VHHQLLRMIDANVNRACEGLRVLEDVARFAINDRGLSQRLRAARHDLVADNEPLHAALLSGRDSEYDVGRHAALPPIQVQRKTDTEYGSTADLLGLVTANAKRVEQALRVIEELAKTPELSSTLDSGRFGQTRFAVYAIERDLFSRISRRDKRQQIQGLYVILDRQFLAGRDELEVARQTIDGGASVIQLRDKVSAKRELLAVAQKIKELCCQARVLFIVDDQLDIAVAAEADGLHIGQLDLPLPVVRRQLPVDTIVGCSVAAVSQAKRAQCEGADYIAVGSIFPTTTKRDATVVGAATLKAVKQSVSLPVVAIGGINQDNIGEVVSAGADAVAVISAVLREEDVAEAVRSLVAELELLKGRCQSR
jgi:thiamine-phosphate pyrophosphorylase